MALDSVENLVRTLRAGSAVQVNERLAVDGLREDGKVSADSLDVVWSRGNRGSHGVTDGGGQQATPICYICYI
jgi:hypothetical protein